jgi:hypothetical protein
MEPRPLSCERCHKQKLGCNLANPCRRCCISNSECVQRQSKRQPQMPRKRRHQSPSDTERDCPIFNDSDLELAISRTQQTLDYLKSLRGARRLGGPTATTSSSMLENSETDSCLLPMSINCRTSITDKSLGYQAPISRSARLPPLPRP